jgi:hypothetical protein
MIQIDETSISKLILHRIFPSENNCIINDTLIENSNEDEDGFLKKTLLKSFLSLSNTFEFKHDVNIEYNVLFNLSKNIHNGNDFIETSSEIMQHLIGVSKHPNIKDGDVFIAKFDDIKIQNKPYQALGIFKFEDKDSFIETSVNDSGMGFHVKKGIGNKKPDKACLILFTEEPYTLFIIDSNNDTDYWQNEFINLKPKNDYVNNTNNFLTLTKNFITKQVPTDFVVNKTDQIDLLNRSVEYFKTREKFDKQEFEDEVFQDKEIIKSFRNFDSTYREEKDIEITDDFEISPEAVKKQARVFKSVLKLDKNFHIYIHGDKQLIEQGVEKDGRKFYKIYFDKEL